MIVCSRSFRPDDLVLLGADADERDRHAHCLGDELQVLARGVRQVGIVAALAEVSLQPASSVSSPVAWCRTVWW